MQLVGLRYTEPDMTVSYPGFLYLLMKMESMIRKGGRCGVATALTSQEKEKCHINKNKSMKCGFGFML